MRAAQSRGALALDIEPTAFRLSDHERCLTERSEEIDRFQSAQRTAFAAERKAWTDAGEFERING
jgi:urea carboxylase